jgi:hypothetical protein
VGSCRRQAPHLNPVTAKAYVVEGVWPLVRDDDWCGEWEVVTRAYDWAQQQSLPVSPQEAQPSRVRPAPADAAEAATAGDD